MLLYTCPNEEQRWRPNAGNVEKPHLLGCAGMTEKKLYSDYSQSWRLHSAILFLGINPRDIKMYIHANVVVLIFMDLLFVSSKSWKQSIFLH